MKPFWFKFQFGLVYFIIELNLFETANLIDRLKTTTGIREEALKFNPITYLINYGYLQSDLKVNDINKKAMSSLNLVKSPSDRSIKEAIKKFQKFANLTMTGHLDDETLRVMQLPRCGHPDLKANFLKKKRYVLQGSKWAKGKLKWRVGKYPQLSSMTNEMFDEEISRAFDLWSSVSGLEFDQIKGPNHYGKKEDIEIRFESGFHGDSEPFDGPGLILGHAFFPEFSGSTHFDADEAWTSKRTDGVNFYQVAVHELGHALGLEHSDNYEAIMAPFFRGFTDDFHLHQDDLVAIEMLYGPNVRNEMLNKKTETKPVEKYDARLNYLCSDGKFDAITQLSDFYTYIFKGSQVYKFNVNRRLEPGFPKLINSVFRDWSHSGFNSLPNNLDAVLYMPENRTTYFFKNNLYWKSSALYEIDANYPRLISADFKGLNSKNGFKGKLDAVFVWSGNRRTYFVSGDKYWRFDFATGWVEPGYPKSFSYWRGLDSKISNAFLYSDDQTYFFKDDLFYKFNDQLFQVDDEFNPQPTKDYWFYCNLNNSS